MKTKHMLVWGLLVLCLIVTVVFASCKQSSGGDDDVATDDDTESSGARGPVGMTGPLPEGLYQCELERVYEFDDDFCDDCCGTIWDGDDDDDETDYWQCNWFIDVNGKTWTVCGPWGTSFDFRMNCYSKMLRFCGHDNWRLPTLAEIQELREFDESRGIFLPRGDWLWIDEPASAFGKKGVSEDDLPEQLACFNFRTGEIGCTEGERWDLLASALFVWP